MIILLLVAVQEAHVYCARYVIYCTGRIDTSIDVLQLEHLIAKNVVRYNPEQ